MKNILTTIGTSILFLIFLISCNSTGNQNHFLTDAAYRREVHQQFLARQQMAAHRAEALFTVFDDDDLSLETREALEFLYAYMPLCDLADYDGCFFKKQVETAFAARDFFHWGKTVPEDIFRHFVLVYRVNNEYLDTARLLFFNALKERVKGLSMAEAALEVNHWCHEQVNYRATDGRTSAPLALMRTSWGRCGEESTFTVTALRAVGIPARQCYTPRWVHTDDNHAWVEVWIDGKWHYMGACEPEPKLDMAWFTAPAKRTMMVHTNVFGLYKGPEEKNLEKPLYSIINLLDNYADTRQVKVKVIDRQGAPVEGAKVKFKVYNYAELYPVCENITGKEGTTSIISGKGDLMIWASMDNRYGYEKSSTQDEVVTVVLNRVAGEIYTEAFTMNVPPEQNITPVSSEKVAENERRLAYEDSIRNAYMSTFPTETYAYEVATTAQLERKNVWKYLHAAQGNWKEIEQFMLNNRDKPRLFPFLATLSEKDLRDTPEAYLSDHFRDKNVSEMVHNVTEKMFVQYVLSPRIALELIKPWRSFFQQKEIMEDIVGANPSAATVMDYIQKNIVINDAENYYNCLLTPQSVYELKIANQRSCNVFFVAVCRSLGIPAQIETATGQPHYFEDGKWNEARFTEDETDAKAMSPKATLTLINTPSNNIKPEYYTHYTVAAFKDGDFQTLDYEDDPAVSDFPYTLSLDAGYYRLMSGSRANDGSVVVQVEYFELKADEHTEISITLPKITAKLLVHGTIDLNTLTTTADGSKKFLKTFDNNKGLMLCFLDPGKEPSKHILQDFPAQQQDLETWGGGVLLIIPDDKHNVAFDPTVFKNLPQQTTWATDHDRSLLKTIVTALQIDFHDNFPLTVYLSTGGEIFYYSQGYKIGISEEVLKIMFELSILN
ncbi:MAG: transglutaminase-like domain-containing protein [Bacteroidales bacterium]|nr:transglutaminase-like domain-containing protein [Bacteroidales bacterium]